MNVIDLSKIPPRPKDGLLNVLIEIPGQSHNKYELDKDTGCFMLDRVLFSAVYYPTDYGFVPNTLADDGDPLDGLVIMDQPTFCGCLIVSRPIGVLEMLDGGEGDEKILCVPAKDPRYATVKELSDIAPHRLDEILEFFATYKRLEKKSIEIKGWAGLVRANELIEKAIAAYT
jgi:inorganic pyrophosphatase